MAGPAIAGWMAIGAAGRTAAKKYGALIARKMFPKLFKKIKVKAETKKRNVKIEKKNKEELKKIHDSALVKAKESGVSESSIMHPKNW